MLEDHNPDAQCLECCTTNEKLSDLLVKFDVLLNKVSDPNAIDDMPPMLKMIMKMVTK